VRRSWLLLAEKRALFFEHFSAFVDVFATKFDVPFFLFLSFTRLHRYVGASRATDAGNTINATTLQSTCIDMASEVNDALLKSRAYVGKRSILADGDHYYTGYRASSMSVEYNTECHFGQAGDTDICTCVPQNSDNWALAHDSVKFSSCAVIYEDADGHDSTSGPWDTTTTDDAHTLAASQWDGRRK